MNTQQSLDKWITKCIQHYNNNSNKKISMKTVEERIEQLEKAHSRLHNQLKDVQEDLIIIKDRMGNNYLELTSKIDNILNTLQPKEEIAALPDELKNGIEYKAIVSEIIKTKDVEWKRKNYTNYELKLEGKEEYMFLAFVPTDNKIIAGDKVRFTYQHPFQCRKLTTIDERN